MIENRMLEPERGKVDRSGTSLSGYRTWSWFPDDDEAFDDEDMEDE